MNFVPQFLLFVAILFIGWLIARLVARALDAVLHRVGFNRLVERGSLKKMLDRTKLDASAIIAKIAFWTIAVFVAQLAFSSFGPNPISALLSQFITYLPHIFYAVVILIVASLLANVVRDILQVTLGRLSYGRFVASAAAGAILVVGFFAALDELNVARNIVNGLFYAALFTIAGSAVIAIGCGGIAPMRSQLEKIFSKAEREAPKVATEAAASAPEVKQTAQSWEHKVEEVHPEPPQERPRFKS